MPAYDSPGERGLFQIILGSGRFKADGFGPVLERPKALSNSPKRRRTGRAAHIKYP